MSQKQSPSNPFLWSVKNKDSCHEIKTIQTSRNKNNLQNFEKMIGNFKILSKKST